VVGITGASGVDLAVMLLERMGAKDVEAHVVISEGAVLTYEKESRFTPADISRLAYKVHDLDDLSASIASGTFRTDGMVVVPCSMKTVAGIALGYSDNLLLRAADVTIKENRRLVLVTRECPLSRIHLKNMLALAEMGVIIMPPMLTFYHRPLTVEDMMSHIVEKILNVFGLDTDAFKRWC